MTDKAKIEDVVESIYSLPPGMFSEFGRAAYENGVAHADEREGVLIQSVKAYAASLKNRDSRLRPRGNNSGPASSNTCPRCLIWPATPISSPPPPTPLGAKPVVGTVNRRTRDKVLENVKRNATGMSLLS